MRAVITDRAAEKTVSSPSRIAQIHDFGSGEELSLFDSLFHEVDEAIAIISVRGPQAVIVDVNTRFERRFGIRRSCARGTNFSALIPTTGRNAPAVRKLRAALSERRREVVDLHVRGADDRLLWARATVRPFHSPTDDDRFLLIFQGDETGKDVNARLLTFLSHDLRTPLNGILGFSEIMMSGLVGPLDDADYKSYARDIHAAGHDLLRLIDGLLDLRQDREGGIELAESVFPLRDVIEAGLAMTCARARAAGVVVRRSLARDLPAFRGDAPRLRQAVAILIMNAVTLTPRGSTVRLTARRNEGEVEIICRDGGRGISEQELPYAFPPYGRGEDVYTSSHTGIGAGLPLVKILVERHGGTVGIASRAGRGAAVSLRLPAARVIGP